MKYRELVELLEQHDWLEVRKGGNHMVYGHPDRQNRLVIPYHSRREVKKGLLHAILKEAGLKTRKR
jgi:predicted RNA binding protein YcfA (HicA-like mRNA interferase family)